ncbi:hypothetical protein MOPEL_136_00020 [Mobilicoccus pelagius NBRC 104925]|uniref:Uncharacterized protein n=1 Tax=Mobilicoccus pelagius NBRC 104925 TaxID=1089455 RepID=H5UW81_9MICO|nr:hypothetical protein MOPEL_136_00020 [Mobilicoccus pelagius NBRC 104925]
MATVDIFVSPLPDDGSDVWEYYFEQPAPEPSPTTSAPLLSWVEAADQEIEQRGGSELLLENGPISVRDRVTGDTCYLQLNSQLSADDSESLRSALEGLALSRGLFCIDPLGNIARLPDGTSIEFTY